MSRTNRDGQRHRRPGIGSHPWAVLVVVLLAGMAAPFNVYKVPPLMPILMGALHVAGGGAGALMSVFSVSGLLFALPAGFAFQKMGQRATGLLSMTLLVIGSGLGSLCTSAGPLVATRLIEGMGVTLIGVSAPAIVSIHFTGNDRATALSVWSTYVPLGSAIIFTVAPFFGSRWGWESVWRAGCLYAFLAGVLWALFIRPSQGQRADEAHESSVKAIQASALRKALASKDLWLFSLLYCAFALVFTSFLSWTPTYLFTVRHQSLAFASLLVGLVPVVGIVGSPLAGWLLRRIGSAKALIVVPMALFAFTGPLTLFVGTGLLLPFVVLVGLVAAFVPTGLFVVAARAVHDNEARGMAMAITAMGFNAGALLGPIIFGYALEHLGGWGGAF
jgi:MFS family permease